MDTIQDAGFFLTNIWCARIKVVWGGGTWDTEDVFNSTICQIEYWRDSHHRTLTEDPQLLTWELPLQGTLKCNVNAALCERENRAAYDFVLRDYEGTFVDAGNGPITCFMDPTMVEAMLHCC